MQKPPQTLGGKRRSKAVVDKPQTTHHNSLSMNREDAINEANAILEKHLAKFSDEEQQVLQAKAHGHLIKTRTADGCFIR